MRNGNVAFLALVTVLAAGPAFAQGAAGTTGTIQGQVVDESFAALPGVAITASGSAMLGTQTTTSGPEGNYRLLGVPAGTYKLVFEMSGFGRVVRDDVRVGIGFTASVNVTMKLRSMEEELTVTGESTPIDTAATRVQTNFDKGMLEALPNARDMWSPLAETPAVTSRVGACA
jgi:Carboxypeptidase regulatory-like domain